MKNVKSKIFRSKQPLTASSALEAAQAGYFLWDISEGMIHWEMGPSHLSGLLDSGTKMAISDLLNRIHPGCRERVRLAFAGLEQSGGVFTIPFRISNRDESIFWLEMKGRVFENEKGYPLYATGIFTDITERKWTREIAEKTETLERIIDHLPVMLVFYDRSGFVQFLNREFQELTGWTMDDVRAQGIMVLCYPDPEYRERVWNFMMNSDRNWGDFEIRTREGEILPSSWTNIPLPDGSQVGIGIDIGERLELERQRENLFRKLQEDQASLQKKNRQLRQLALRLTSAEQQERRQVAQTLHDHFQQLLVAAKIGLAQMKRQIRDEALSRLVREVDSVLDETINASRTLAVELCPPLLYDRGLAAALRWLGRHFEEQHGLSVTVEANPEDDPEGEEVQAFLFQSVRELLFNVVKHAQTGVARVSLVPAEGDRITLSVEDQGRGCEGHEIWNSAGNGTGFGLTNIRQRLELLGGGLLVFSKPGEGCRVVLSVPKKQSENAENALGIRKSHGQTRQKQTRAFPGLGNTTIRVLLVDDHELLREGLRSLLEEDRDIEIVGEAVDGLDAIERCRELKPEVIAMDVSMPRMNGIEATRQIKEEMPEVEIIGLSMHEDNEIKQAMLEAGARTYLTKGGPSEALAEAIRIVAKKR